MFVVQLTVGSLKESLTADRKVEMINRKQMKIFFILYLLIILKIIVFKYPVYQLKDIASSWSRDVIWEGLYKANFEVFKTIKLYIRYWDYKKINSFANLIGNILAFIPLSYMLPRVCRPAQKFLICMFFSFLFILGIELFQLFSAFGIFDIDDILLNMVGALIGYLLYLVIRAINKKIE